ncbi:uncharacterized protein EDB93DRAFT_148282 [Suillus bovinus]|uniref:uncharacterized protein n=1 Tax=Suillus bovinus TaxID=48563 RepID=UPI001B87949D|nr:uncharacterized protein EDB93DRAFT_148282 [Suillus bovinus]KAG2128751.1 hypothetical protein EDB93DRAFT_148282 [Suillus bovinus]
MVPGPILHHTPSYRHSFKIFVLLFLFLSFHPVRFNAYLLGLAISEDPYSAAAESDTLISALKARQNASKKVLVFNVLPYSLTHSFVLPYYQPMLSVPLYDPNVYLDINVYLVGRACMCR